MLNESCTDCLVPLMKSKKGEKICFGCNKDYAIQPKIEEPQVSKQQLLHEDLTKTKKIPERPQVPIASQQSHKMSADADIFSRIEGKALSFIEKRIDRAIEDNDLNQLERLMELAFKIKNEFR